MNQQDEWPISPDKYVFIEHHIHTYRECIEGECQKLCIDFPNYGFDQDTNALTILNGFKVNKALKIVYGYCESLSGDAGTGIASYLTPVNKLPYKESGFGAMYSPGGLEVATIESDGTAHIKYNEISVVLKAGENWVNTTTKVDIREDDDNLYNVRLTIIDTIVNYGILDKSKIRK